MSDRFGVHKLILLNSGGFRRAEFDLARPVHFAGGNNGGKTTLVNALQFLLVDEFEKMVFGDHDWASTRHHYFGQTPSYIVFECLTHSGPQCLVVAGSGEIAGSKFSRFVYRGAFDAKHYEDGKHYDDGNARLADLTSVRKNLFAAEVLEVKHNRLWRVLCTPSDRRGDDNEASRLGILPLKRVEDYHSFREVFIKLLSLGKAQADELKRLLIACSCQAVHTTAVDVRKQYTEPFGRLERDDKELNWLTAVVPAIDEGISLRATVAELDRQMAKIAIGARGELQRCIGVERLLTLAMQVERNALPQAQKGCKDRRDLLNREIGSLNDKVDDGKSRLDALDAEHCGWAQVTDLHVNGWKGRCEQLQHLHQDTELKLRESGQYDYRVLEGRYKKKQQELEQHTRELNDWESRTSGYLNGLGFSPAQLGTLFTLINPAIARASHRQVLGHADPSAVKLLVDQTVSAFTERSFTERSFSMNGISINLSAIAVPDDVASSSRETAQERVSSAEQELAHLNRLVDVARDVEATRDQQRLDQAECTRLTQKIGEHADHIKAYSNKSQMMSEVQVFRERRAGKLAEIPKFEKEDAELLERIEVFRSTQGELARANKLRSALNTQLSQVQIGPMVGQLDDIVPDTEGTQEKVSDLLSRLQRISRQLERLSQQLTDLQQRRTETADKIRTIQQKIAIESRKRGARNAVFDHDAEKDWAELENLRSVLDEKAQSLQMLWNAMFKSLAGELDLLRRSVAEVKKRATRINADLKRYKVSNLESVEVVIDHDTGEYAVIEKMTSAESMFLKDHDIAEAKRELQQWITVGKTIELRDIFTVRIRIQNQGELRPMDVASIDEIGSQGTGMTAKVMIYLQLLRSSIDDEKNEYQMHFFLDEIGKLDDRNLHATTDMAVRRGFVPITAEPESRAESLAHPEVLIYYLGKSGKEFEIVQKLTYKARAKARVERDSA